jgi:hypothetical protein
MNGSRATASQENMARITVVNDLYASGKIVKYETAENLAKRLINKSTQKMLSQKPTRHLLNWLPSIARSRQLKKLASQ